MARGFKTGGRKQGAANRVTKEIRVLIKEILEKEFDTMSKKLNELSTKDRLEIIIKLLPYALPKVDNQSEASQEVDDDYKEYLKLKGVRKLMKRELEYFKLNPEQDNTETG